LKTAFIYDEINKKTEKMTNEELKKYKRPLPMAFTMLPIDFIYEHIEDEHGVYETGMFTYKGKDILINKEMGEWHLSVSANHTLGYYELKEIRYKFMPDSMQVAQIFPPRKEFVNLHENCFHLYQIKFDK